MFFIVLSKSQQSKGVTWARLPLIVETLVYFILSSLIIRNHIEASYWYQAVSSLSAGDIDKLQQIIRDANQKLQSDPIQIPQAEHRQLHMTIYRRLENEFVLGILETYRDIYEAVGLSVYEDRKYLEHVWQYHQQMVDSLVRHDYLSGYQALIAHMDLLYQREKQPTNLPFE